MWIVCVRPIYRRFDLKWVENEQKRIHGVLADFTRRAITISKVVSYIRMYFALVCIHAACMYIAKNYARVGHDFYVL